MYFHEAEGERTRQVIISVKSGNVSVPHLRDLRGVLNREEADIGVLITLEPPTMPMRREAANAGFFESRYHAHDTKYPRLQILTIEDLLSGKRIDMPPIRHTSVTFKRARRVKRKPDTKEKRLEFGDE